MSRRFLGALARGDLNEIRRELFLEPLLRRNSGAHPAPGPEEVGGDPGGEAATTPPEAGTRPGNAVPTAPSDSMALPKPPSQSVSSFKGDSPPG